MYKIVAFMGKAGAGKDTLLQECLALEPGSFHEIVSCTTRPPREGEVDGVNYHFLTSEEFAERLEDGRMIEATVFRDWCYGTSFENLDEDKINIGVFNPAGIDILNCIPDVAVLAIYITAEDKIRMLRQLNREEHPDVKEIVRRYFADEDDFNGVESLVGPELVSNNGDVGIGAVATAILNAIKKYKWPEPLGDLN